MPYTALVALVKVEVYGGAVNDVALFEQLHDLRVFGIAELRLEIIQLADGLVVQIALAGALDHRPRSFTPPPLPTNDAVELIGAG